MQLSFVTLQDNGCIDHDLHNIPTQIMNDIIDNLELSKNKEYVISFSSFVDYNKEFHGKAIKYLLHNMSNNIERTVVSEDPINYQVTYSFKDINNVTESLDTEQLKFLCAILHNLNLKKYLVPCVILLSNEFEFDEIKDFCKDPLYKMTIFAK